MSKYSISSIENTDDFYTHHHSLNKKNN
ncbi:hypothetical protein G210_0921 [Candida maltosa Xu316]|uniref:Uncharacterized protein n=1 Tax=Candida maltosa (strain Xu316) TaxID=1245528 RepID=M3IPW8_CANMX|nr:hypothetical protein G210_0921 [Candida maltosa Xu316]